jgi:hypothetical protein
MLSCPSDLLQLCLLSDRVQVGFEHPQLLVAHDFAELFAGGVERAVLHRNAIAPLCQFLTLPTR